VLFLIISCVVVLVGATAYIAQLNIGGPAHSTPVTPGPADAQALSAVKGCINYRTMQAAAKAGNVPGHQDITFKVTGYETDIVDVEADFYVSDSASKALYTYRVSSGQVVATDDMAHVYLPDGVCG
jgi:hypothetical protein